VIFSEKKQDMKKQNLDRINRAVNKKILASAILMVCATGASTLASAALSTSATLNFIPGVTTTSTSSATFVKSGSYFGMDNSGNGKVSAGERTAIVQFDGLIVGTVQTASGSHGGSVDGSETPGFDKAWEYFGNTGLQYASVATTISSDDNSGAVTLDFSGWGVTWNGITAINMGGGTQQCGTASDGICVDGAGTDIANAYDNGTGVATVTCAAVCAAGETYTLDYSANVPQADPSNFGGVLFVLHLEGTIAAGNTAPVAVDDTLSPDPAYNSSTFVRISPAANDTDADAGEQATLTAVCPNNGTKGTVTDNGDSTCDYLPNAGAIGTDSFTYTVSDVNGATDTGTVNVTITDQEAPVISITAGTDSVEAGGSWTDAGATATDNYDDNATVTANITATGTVDTSTVGTYTVTYTATDAAGNTSTADRTVTVTADVTAPVITVTSGTDSVVIGGSWTDAGATATDNLDSSVTVSTSGTVDVNTIGSYTITYTATDTAGNTATTTRTVSITATPDTTPPVVTVTAGTDTIIAGNSWTDAGATATDDVDGTLSVTASGSVNTSTVGSYTITYTATDSAGNIGTATRIVTVTAAPDTTPPVITVTAGTDSVVIGSSWTDAGATATDNVDSSVTVNTSGSVDVNTVGSYTITYTATDAAGNVATPATRTVTVTAAPPADTTPPVITVTVGTDSIEAGDSWTDAGATATDDVDGTLSPSASGSVDTRTAGTYTITYTATDNAGNVETATRTVTVTADVTAPVITVAPGTDSVVVGAAWTDAGATATDNLDTSVIVTVSGSVDINTAGSYTVTYGASDAAGNAATATRVVTVTAAADNDDENIFGCSMSPTPINASNAADWWVVAGFIGFMAVRRRKEKEQS